MDKSNMTEPRQSMIKDAGQCVDHAIDAAAKALTALEARLFEVLNLEGEDVTCGRPKRAIYPAPLAESIYTFADRVYDIEMRILRLNRTLEL
jgi:hypothetical protein